MTMRFPWFVDRSNRTDVFSGTYSCAPGVKIFGDGCASRMEAFWEWFQTVSQSLNPYAQAMLSASSP